MSNANELNTGIKNALISVGVDISGLKFGEEVDGNHVLENDALREMIQHLGFVLFTRHDIGEVIIPVGEPYIAGWDSEDGEFVHVHAKISGVPSDAVPSTISAFIRLGVKSKLWTHWHDNRDEVEVKTVV